MCTLIVWEQCTMYSITYLGIVRLKLAGLMMMEYGEAVDTICARRLFCSSVVIDGW